MAYTTTLQVAQDTGVGVQVAAELLGTGDNSDKSFDLDNGNVVAGSYSLYHSASGDDANDFSELTETTDYTLNKDRGTVLLTASGVTAVGTDNLYIDYVHSPKISDSEISTILDRADEEVERATGTYWGTPRTRTEFFDGRRSFEYPTTDRPYADDYDRPDEVNLDTRNLIEVTGAYFLKRGETPKGVFSFDDSASSFTDNTAEARSPRGTGFNPFAATTAANDLLYVGATNKYFGFFLNYYTEGVTASSNTIEYYNGSTWVDFTSSATESQTGVLDLEAEGSITWDALDGWSETDVDGTTAYWVRVKAGGAYSTEASIRYLRLDQDLVISQEIALHDLEWTDEGRVIFYNQRFPNGERNVRVDYREGQTTTDDLIAELAGLYAGLRIYAKITGGSYDDATSYSLGSKSVGIGEVYVNVREVVKQFRERIDEILRRKGQEFTIGVA